MDVQELLQGIIRRPGMFVQDTRLDYIKYFIAGFYCHSALTNSASPIDHLFSREFHGWVRKWIDNHRGIQFEQESGWYEYITAATVDNEEAFQLFVKLVNEFFEEFHAMNNRE